MTVKEKEAIDVLFHLAHINTYLDLDTKDIFKISKDIIEEWKNASNVILNLTQKQQEELEKKDKQIDLMSRYIYKRGVEYEHTQNNRQKQS